MIERFLAAKLFASWSAYLEDGTAAVKASVGAAHALLLDEIEKACREAGRSLDAGLLLHAIGQTDLQLLHRVEVLHS